MQTGLLCFLLALQTGTVALNPALTPSPDALARIWKTGYTRAGRDKNLKRAQNLARIGFGKANGITVSWLTLQHPRWLAYKAGFEARKSKATPEQQVELQTRLPTFALDATKRLRFHGEIGIVPHGFKGANPENLKDVRVELVVGERRYPPDTQPGDVIAQKHHEEYWDYDLVTTSRTVCDSDGKTHQEYDQQWVPRWVNYTWYQGDFDAEFSLFNLDGTPRVTDADQEITVLISGGFGEQKAVFPLKVWRDAYEK